MALRPETLNHYRQLLIQRREELASEASRAESQVRNVQDGDRGMDVEGDAIDLTSSEIDRAALLDLAQRDVDELRQVDAALAALDDGTYGICAECGQEIPQARLDAIPRATLCIRHQESLETRVRNRAGQGGALSQVVA